VLIAQISLSAIRTARKLATIGHLLVLREPVLIDLCRRLDRGKFDDVASAPRRIA
jgi:hypothetical protein